MDSVSDPYEGATSPNGSVETAPSKRKAKPRIHEHEIHGPMLASEVRTHYEHLVEEEGAASGAAKRVLGSRRHLVGLMLRELEEFHGIDEGGL